LLIHTEELQLQVAGAANALGKCSIEWRQAFGLWKRRSAADASHLTTEYVCRFSKIAGPIRHLARDARRRHTAIGNDYCFEDLFARRWKPLAPGDVLMAFYNQRRAAE